MHELLEGLRRGGAGLDRDEPVEHQERAATPQDLATNKVDDDFQPSFAQFTEGAEIDQAVGDPAVIEEEEAAKMAHHAGMVLG